VTACCPTCGQPLPTSDADQIEAKTAEVRAWCQRTGVRVTVDDFIPEGDAAAALGRCRGTIRNWKHQGRGFPHKSVRGRVFVPIEAVAAALLGID
jgi:hypothetical protein